MSQKRGFTLIELLVVIAIIGILASVVLASLNSARNKGSDAKVESQMAQIRSAAEIYYTSNGSYGTANVVADGCNDNMWADPASGMTKLVAGGSYPDGAAPSCQNSSTAWVAWHPLISDTTRAWCADSTGASLSIAVASAPAAGDYTCE